MQWEFVVALVLAVPIILFPMAFAWYLNIGGIYVAVREAWQRKAAREERAEAAQARPTERELVGTRR